LDITTKQKKRKEKNIRDMRLLKGFSGYEGFLYLGYFTWDSFGLEDTLCFSWSTYIGCWDSVFSFLGLWIRGFYDGVKPPKGEDYGRSIFSCFNDRDRWSLEK